MKVILLKKNFLAVEDYGDFIVIFHFNPSMGIYRGIRIKKDKLADVISALGRVTTGKDYIIKVDDASPGSSGAIYDAGTDIVVRAFDGFIFIERGEFIPWVSFPSDLTPDLIELLAGNVPSGADDVENQIIHIPQGTRFQRWTNVLNFGVLVVIMNLDSDDVVGGAMIPLLHVDQLIKSLLASKDSVEITLANKTDMLMLDSVAIDPLIRVLRKIKNSQQP